MWSNVHTDSPSCAQKPMPSVGDAQVEAEAAEPAQPQADEEDDRRAADNLQGGGAAEGEVVLLQRDVGGNAHDEHEERNTRSVGVSPFHWAWRRGA